MQNAFNRVILVGLAAAFVFFAIASVVELKIFITVLNGVYFGTAAAIMIAYGRLLWNAVKGVRPYDRVRQMTIGFFLMHVAYGLGVAVSFYFRASGMEINSFLLTAASRYVAVLAAVLQVTAPDFGLGLFHGRDRKVLFTGIGVGLAVAIVMTFAQTEQVLAEQGLGAG